MPVQLSIIVPIYNVGAHLRKCLQSILEQKLKSYEVILVNDASRDNSYGIAKEWCDEHKEFRLLNHEKNQGLSAARNTGLDHSTGEYVTFVDSDDFLMPGTLQACLEKCGNADVIEYPIQKRHFTNSPERWVPNFDEILFEDWMKNDGFNHCYACNKVYRMHLWKDTRFPLGMYFEDIRTIPKVLGKANYIKGSDKGLYYYCERDGSISKSKNEKNLKEFTTALVELLEHPVNAKNHKLYIRALNAQRTYKQPGGKNTLVPHKKVPWSFFFEKTLTLRERLKFLCYKITRHA